MTPSHRVTYVFITQRLQQEEEDGFKVFVPHSHVVFSRDLQQLHQGSLPLLTALVVIGQFLQQVGYQVRVVLTDCLPRERTRGNRNAAETADDVIDKLTENTSRGAEE